MTIDSEIIKIAQKGFSKSEEGYNAEYPYSDRKMALPQCITKEEILNFKLALLEIIKGVKPPRKDNMCEFDPRIDVGEINKAERKGFNQGVETYEKAIEEKFK